MLKTNLDYLLRKTGASLNFKVEFRSAQILKVRIMNMGFTVPLDSMFRIVLLLNVVYKFKEVYVSR